MGSTSGYKMVVGAGRGGKMTLRLLRGGGGSRGRPKK